MCKVILLTGVLVFARAVPNGSVLWDRAPRTASIFAAPFSWGPSDAASAHLLLFHLALVLRFSKCVDVCACVRVSACGTSVRVCLCV